jgi:hypothetical protein
MAWVRVRIKGVGEWSQPADKPLREDLGEQLVPDSEHEAPYRDHPEPDDENRPRSTPGAVRRAGRESTKGA